MSRPTDPARLDHAIELYLAGKPIKEITAAVGINAATVNRERLRRGIPSLKERSVPISQVITEYLAGDSVATLAARYSVARGTIEVRLRRAGVELRSSADATRLWQSRETAAERAARAHAAAEGCRTPEHRQKLSRSLSGITRDAEQLVNRAVLREQAAAADPFHRNISDEEREFSHWLVERGQQPIAQKAIDRYNVDLAMAPVAVEILGGGWHSSKRQHAVRTPKILDAGWHLVFVWSRFVTDGGWQRMTAAAADYVIAFLDEVRRNPPAASQYRVIAGDGQLMASGSGQDDEFAFIPPPRRSLDTRR